MGFSQPMDTTLILAKTAKGMLAAKTEGGDLNYDAVRLLRLVDGKASVGVLRPQFEDFTDTRFQKAMATLERKGLIRVLEPTVRAAGEHPGAPKINEQVRELAQEFLQTLDFTALERKLLETMRSSQTKPEVAVASSVVPHQRLLECLKEAVFQTDLAGKNVYVNPAWTQLTGYSSDDTLGRRLAEFFIAQDQRGMALCLDRIARGMATPPFFKAYLARKVGAPLRVEVRAAPLTTISGDIIGVCGTLRDAGAAQEREKGS